MAGAFRVAAAGGAACFGGKLRLVMFEQSPSNAIHSEQGLGGQLREMVVLLRAGRCGNRLLLLGAALVVVIAATAWYQILLNAWNKPFYDSLTRKDFPAFLQQLRVFAE